MSPPAGRITAAGLATRLIDNALAELGERAERMTDDALAAEIEAIAGTGRSAGSDLVAAILEREHQRRWKDARS